MAQESSVEKALEGGRAEKQGVTEDDFDKDVVEEAADHESEHSDDPDEQKQIALDHLAEDKDYYKKLKKIEKSRTYSKPSDFEGLSSVDVFDMAKEALASGDPLYFFCKGELARRDFVAKAMASLGYPPGVTADAGGRVDKIGADLRGKQPERDKKVFEAMHGVDTEGETSDEGKEDLRKEIIAGIKEQNVDKAILTKDSASKEKKPSQAKSNPSGKVGVNSKGKTYQYDEKGKGKPAPFAQPEKPTVEDVEPEAVVDESKLAGLIGTDVATLTKLAHKMDEHKFVQYFEINASDAIQKFEIPSTYWATLHAKLANAPVVKKSTAALTQFTVHASVYEKGSELYNVASSLKKAKIRNMPMFEDFVKSNFDVTGSSEKRVAKKLFKALVSDGAIRVK